MRRSARQQAMLDTVSSAAHGAPLPRSASRMIIDMGGGQFAINLTASGAQLRPSMDTFTCMCCGDGRTWRCGNAFVNVKMHLASKAHWKKHRRQVYDLDDDYRFILRGKPLRRVCTVQGLALAVLEVQCECRWPCVELYNLL